MKKLYTAILVTLSIFSLALGAKTSTPKFPTLKIGSQAPDWNLKGVDGKMHQLSDYADKDVLMLVFTCNHCPDAQAAENKLISIVNDYKDQSFALVAISGNNPESLRLDELRFAIHGDSYEDMIEHAEIYEFNFPYLYDGDDQITTMAYGARSTPHVFILDKERKIRYTGRVDNSKTEELGDQQEARDAIDALLVGKEIETPVTRSFGCSTKWLYKKELVAKDNEKWNAKPVTIETLDKETLEEIVKNEKGPLKLINVWASYCGPCVTEMPDLRDIYRIYQHRIEFITISIDKLKHQQKALDILQDNNIAPGQLTEQRAKKGGRLNNNFIWHSTDLDELADTLDTEWEGPLPYTLMIAPGGEVVYRHHEGEIDPQEIRHAIIDQLGRFWE